MMTSTAAVRRSFLKWVPLRTSEVIPVKYIPDLLQAIYALTLSAPPLFRDTVLENFAGTGVDVITTRNVGPAG